MHKPEKPTPPPMRIGDRGDTIDAQGVRRKHDGTLRGFNGEVLTPYAVAAIPVLLVGGILIGRMVRYWMQ